MRDRHRRLLGIEVDRRHVQREVLVHLDHEQARDARRPSMPGAARNRSVTQSLSSPGVERRRACRRRRRRACCRAIDRARCAAARVSGGVPSTKRVLRALDRRLDAIARRASPATRMPPSLKRSPAGRVVNSRNVPCVPSRSGTRHRAQLGAVEPIRRKRDRHAQDRAPDAVLAEDRPERLRLAQQPQLGLLERNPVASELEERARPCRCAPTTAPAGRCADRDRGSRRCCAAPGCVPVLNDDHATGDTDGNVVCSRR